MQWIKLNRRLKIEDCCNNLMKTPFAQAANRYSSGTGEPLYLDVSSLGLEQHIRRFHLVADSSNSSKYHINLLDFNKFCSIVDGCTLPETVKIFNTAITLGNITLTEVSENTFTIDRDEYNFEMHPWEDECVRNILTLIGEKVNEGIGISANGLQHLIHGKILGRGTDVIDGNVRRHINGQNKSFYIYFNKESRIPSPIQISIIASVLHPNVPNTPILSVEQPQN